MNQRLAFVHRLTQDAAYGALLRSNRLLLHSAAADALAPQVVRGSAAEGDLLAQLAEHLAAAGRWAEAHRRCCELLEVRATAGLFAGWQRWVERAASTWEQAHPGAGPAEQSSALLLNALTARAATQGDLQQAAELARRAAALAVAAHDSAAAARAQAWLAGTLRAWGRFDAAQEHYAAALELTADGALPHLRADVLTSYAGFLSEKSEFEAAAQTIREALALRERLGDLRGMASSLMAQSTIDRLTGGDFASALATRRRALELARQAGSRLLEGWLLGNLANLLSQSGELDQAVAHLQEALHLMRETGDRSTEALFYNNLGVVYGQQGRTDEELACYQRALAVQRALGEMRSAATSLTNLGAAEVKRGRPAAAQPYLAEAVDICGSLGDFLSVASALCHAADAALALGRHADAAAALERAEAALAACGDAQERAMVELRRAHLHAAQGRRGLQLAALRAADALRRRSGLPDGDELARSIGQELRRLEETPPEDGAGDNPPGE
jgi:tetratricopeptide (TPR) repeat protein